MHTYMSFWLSMIFGVLWVAEVMSHKATTRLVNALKEGKKLDEQRIKLDEELLDVYRKLHNPKYRTQQ